MTVKAFASLSSDLLARKGAAAPSAPSMDGPARAPRLSDTGTADGCAGRRDVFRGSERAPLALAVKPESIEQGGPVRMSVRLDARQARRLRLAAALLDVSIQSLMTDAVAEKLDAIGRGPLRNCGCFNR